MNHTPFPNGDLWTRLFALDPMKRRGLGRLLSRGEAADDPEVAAVAAALARWWLRNFWVPAWAKLGGRYWLGLVATCAVASLVVWSFVPLAAISGVLGLTYAVQIAYFLPRRGRLIEAERLNKRVAEGDE
jgi:hypothetical protein